jgi:hypothetical protein
MKLFDRWKKLIEGQTNATFPAFWDKYCEAEARIYSTLLKTPQEITEGSFGDLANAHKTDPVLFMGFLDGILSSLREPIEIEDMTEDSTVRLVIDIEKLYYNMRAAKAEHLYTLPEWDALLSALRREKIAREQRKSGTVTKDKTPGRNDPCPCGSGRKYKKCCGAKAV